MRDGKTGRKSPSFSGGREWLVSGLAIGSLGLLGGFIAVPILALVVWTVSEEAWGAMASPVARDALLLSMKTTAATMVILIVVGTPAAYVLARGTFRGSRALITLSFTTVAVVVAEVFVAAPFYVRQAATGFSGVDRTIEEAALVDGADRTAAFFRVTVPLAFPALVAGAVTAWARALGEFGATIIFAGNFRRITQTIPLAIYSEFQSNIDASVALSVLVLGFAFAVILAVRYFTSKAS
jgi:molybdate transport system permease protein